MRSRLSRIFSSRTAVQLASFGSLVLLVGVPLFAQTFTGRMLGNITDATGAAVNGATVTITDVQRGTTRTLTTDQAGFYVAPDLSPGNYKVRVEAKGFRTVERLNVQLEVAKDVRIDFPLQPGEVSEVVQVSGEVPLVDTTSSTLGGTLSNKEINELPLNGRNYQNLLQLRPGVVRYPGGGFSTTSTNGLRAEDNAYFVDGLFNSEPFSGQSIINGAGIVGDSATILPVDAIQEFNVEENPPAEYGWKPGAIVNVALKQGTNGLHGTAYGFYRDTIFDARNYFNPADTQAKTPRNLKQFGATLGGPIVKDKLFFFGGYEGQRYLIGNSGLEASPATSTLPAPSTPNCTFGISGDCTNSIPNAIADLQAGSIAISPVSLKLAGCTLGPPVTCNGKGFPLNNGTNPAGAGLINIFLPNTANTDNAIGKIDYHFNDRHTLSGLYFFGNNSGTVNDAGEVQPQWLTQIHTRAQVVGTNWTWIPNSRWVNEFRFGYNRLVQPTFTADHNVPATDYGINTGVTNPLYGGLPIVTILPFNVPNTLGGFVWPKVQGPDTRVQFVDHVSYTIGKHALKFGGELHRDSFSGGAYAGGRGRLKFLGGGAFTTGTGSTPLEDFFAGDPTVNSVLIGDPTRHIHNWSEAGFLQDDWRVAKNLTLNLGIRYEYNGVITEENGLLGNFLPAVGTVQVGHGIGSPYNGDHKNFAPRVGFAWDPTGKGSTVVRGAAGVIYETVNWESFLAFNNTLGIASIPTAGASGVLPGTGNIAVGNINLFPPGGTAGAALYNAGPIFPAGTAPVNCAANPCTILAIDPNITTPYVTNWNLNIQHGFNNNLSLEVAYVGNHGSNLVGIHDINQPTVGAGWTPAAIAARAPDPGAEQNARPFNTAFPFLASIYQMGNIYKSNYNGLQATLTARNYHGLSLVAGYTYSHSLDDVGANWDFGQGLGLPQNSVNPAAEYASSDFDIRNRFTLSATYVLPGKKSPGQMLEGWQINSIVTLQSAQPWGPTDSSTDVSGTGESRIASTGIERWDFFGNPKDFTSGSNSIPFFPGTSNPACVAQAATPAMMESLGLFGCYAKGSSIMVPPALGSFGTMGRNFFRDSGFRNWDFSVAKDWHLGERFTTEFRAEFFNILNHPNFANPFGGQNGFGTGGFNDPSVPGAFGCGCATPDKAASNPVIGSGGPRGTQFALKFIF